MQNVLKHAYQADVLLRKVLTHTVGSRFPFKDHVVLTAENSEPNAENPIFTSKQCIEVVIPCENRVEALKLNVALKEYLSKNLMLPLSVGVFQKPYLKDGQKAVKHFSFTNINAKTLLAELPKLEKEPKSKFVADGSNGFSLTYTITDFTFDKTAFTVEDAKKTNKNSTLDKDIFKLKLSTTSAFEFEDGSQSVEIVEFEIACDSENEIDTLAKLMYDNQKNGVVFTCKGKFPVAQKDFYVIKLSKTGAELITQFSADTVKKSA